jgi:hypothetical protein
MFCESMSLKKRGRKKEANEEKNEGKKYAKEGEI